MEGPSQQRKSVAVVSTNRNFRIRSWNAGAELAYGWTAAQAQGRSLDDLLCTQFSGMSAQEAHALLFSQGRLEAQAQHTARDGRVLTDLATLILLRDASGAVIGVEHAFHTLSESPATQADRRQAPQSFSAEVPPPFPGLPADFPGDVWIYDIPSGREWHARNPAGDDAAAPAALPEDAAEAGQAIRSAISEHSQTFSVEHRVPSGAGGAAWALTQGAIRYDREGRPERIYGVTSDITTLRAREEKLRSRSRELDRREDDFAERARQAAAFFSDVSHDFKTPLSIMLVNLQMMEYCLAGEDSDMNKRLLRAVAMMRQNTLRLLRLSGNLLDVTRLDAGFLRAWLVNADIVEIASGIAQAVGNHAAGRGVQVRFESDAAARVMPTDAEKLERILLNLLSNAVKHTPPGGRVTLALRGAPSAVEFRVSDDGSGMTDEVQELLREKLKPGSGVMGNGEYGISPFAPTAQGKAEMPARTGEGLGLMLAKALTELLRGRIWFESEPGKGSAFFVELPVLQADWQGVPPEADGMTRERKVEMEFSDINP